MSEYNVKLQNFNKQDNINKAIISRYITETNLEPNISFRPVPTKYTHFSIFGDQDLLRRNIYPEYDITQMYNSGDRMSHFSGFSNNVDKETILQNRVYALQRDSRATYIPRPDSTLYNDYIPNQNNINKDLDNLKVFNTASFNSHNPNYSETIGSNNFNNSTRVQLKNMI